MFYTMWTRRPTLIGGQTAPDDFTVLRRDQPVGRVTRAVAIPGATPFAWMTWTYPADNGRAQTLDEALDQLRCAIRRRWPDEIDAVPLAGKMGKES